tara:strand:+ start:110 stop:433 length:324 start_codon:yes stop_codon:yes gene_type:complete
LETHWSSRRLGATLLSPERREQLPEQPNQTLNLEAHLAKMNPRSIKLVLRDICLRTVVDRQIDDSERAVLDKVAQAAGLSKAHVDNLLSWTVKGFHWMQGGYNALEI